MGCRGSARKPLRKGQKNKVQETQGISGSHRQGQSVPGKPGLEPCLGPRWLRDFGICHNLSESQRRTAMPASRGEGRGNAGAGTVPGASRGHQHHVSCTLKRVALLRVKNDRHTRVWSSGAFKATSVHSFISASRRSCLLFLAFYFIPLERKSCSYCI